MTGTCPHCGTAFTASAGVEWLICLSCDQRVDLVDPVPPDERHHRRMRAWWVTLAGFVGAALCFGIAIAAGKLGQTVLQQNIQPEALQANLEVQTSDFELDGPVAVVEVWSPLDNAWADVSVALVHGDDTVLHVGDVSLERYSGIEGGERWAEGPDRAEIRVRLPEAGRYRLLVGAAGNTGEFSTPGDPPALVQVTVIDGIRSPKFGGFGMVPTLAIFVVGLAWRNSLGWS